MDSDKAERETDKADRVAEMLGKVLDKTEQLDMVQNRKDSVRKSWHHMGLETPAMYENKLYLWLSLH